MKLPSLLSFLIAIIFFVNFEAKIKQETFSEMENFNFANPKIIHLPQSLYEISGIAYYGKDTSVFAVIHEDPLLYKMSLNYPLKVNEWRFDKQRDFEDLVYKDSTFCVPVSNAEIYKITFAGNKINVNKIEFLNYTKIATAPLFQKMGSKKEKIKPFAVAFNPITKNLNVLCSANKIIFVQDGNGKINDAIALNPKIYKQPEGMTFTPTGDLIISNEVYLEGYATLLLSKNKKKG